MTFTNNPLLATAFDYVQNTHQNVFLTGKAGTGKTTFLRYVKANCKKQLAVVAPTGVAAINAKGVTIHSLFQLPYGFHPPGLKKQINQKRNFSKKKINLLRSLDLLIIDEISMVRADVLDAMDDILRRYRNHWQPFGGVQLLMIGDLHQLPPVVRPENWKLLKEHYTSPYFFDSNALKETNLLTIQLTHIYRQSDQTFIDLLNKVRENHLDESVLKTLNQRYDANFRPQKSKGYITLTALSRTAEAINEQQLSILPKRSHFFEAKIKGEFPKTTYPTAAKLELKIGAQVMFVKNDPSRAKQFYNGKIGQIVAFEEGQIHVQCPDDRYPIKVSPLEWKNLSYQVDKSTQAITEEEKGSFCQYPLKLAYAITIHKSQGLTFEKVIIDAEAAFAHGQVYVALSRCKSFEGIVLRSPLRYESILTDRKVKNYSSEAAKNPPTEQHLQLAKKAYQASLIRGLFDFRTVRNALQDVVKTYLMYQQKLTVSALEQVVDWETEVTEKLFTPAQKFETVLNTYFLEADMPDSNPNLMTRIQKAAIYFSNKIDQQLLPDLVKIPVTTDNQSVRTSASERLKTLRQNLYVKYYCFESIRKEGFRPQKVLQLKIDALKAFEIFERNTNTKLTIAIPKEVPHPQLYVELYNWRDQKAKALQRKPHEVISALAMIEMTKKLPVDKAGMKTVKTFSLVKFKTFGKPLMQLIDDYCYKHQL
ncbi:MAG: AAA family ATPase [Bacteroidota bacterium]